MSRCRSMIDCSIRMYEYVHVPIEVNLGTGMVEAKYYYKQRYPSVSNSKSSVK